MATQRKPDPLDKYLPNEAEAEAIMNGPTEFPSKADPKLVARLKELNRLSSNPELMPPAPPSVAVYVPPVEVRAARAEDHRAEPKVELDVPLAASEYPTQPSLKRLEGEPDLPVPGVVTKSARRARERTPKAPSRPITPRSAALALLTVFVPVLVVLLVMGRVMREQHAKDAAAAAAAAPSVPPLATTAKPSATQDAMPMVDGMAPPATSVVPSTTASAAAPPPKSTASKPKPHGALDDPYDAGPAVRPAPSTTPTAAPSAAPPAVTASAVAPVAPPPVKSPVEGDRVFGN